MSSFMSEYIHNEAASVGSMLPVTEPDQVLTKNEQLSPEDLVDAEFKSLEIYPSDDESDFEEGVSDIPVKLSDLKHRVKLRRAKEKINTEGLRTVEKYLQENDKDFVPYSKMKKTTIHIDKRNPEHQELLSQRESEDSKCHIFKVTYGNDLVMLMLIEITDKKGDTWSHAYNVYGKYKKYWKYYTTCADIQYDMYSFSAKEDITKWIRNIESGKKNILENADDDMLKSLGFDSVLYTEETRTDERIVFEESADDDFFIESAKIDDDIKDIIKTLNEKGYETQYSCSGHPSARSKSDVYRDGIRNGKLYSSARVVFSEAYPFPNIPKGWKKKVMENEGENTKVGIYVEPPHFRVINGLPTEQFNNWKKKYMYSLEKWANELPKREDLKKSDNSDVSVESANDVLDSLLADVYLG